MTLSDVVWTHVDAVEMSTVSGEMFTQMRVNLVNLAESHATQSYAALVGYYNRRESRMVELGNRLGDVGKKVELIPTGDIVTFWRL